MKVCRQPRLFIHFVWFRMMLLPWITVFPIWQERWHYALCLRYQRFAASRCLVLARLGSFTKHEMDKATVMYWRERGKKGERERKREGKRGGGIEKWKDVMGFFCFRERRVAAASGSRCLCLGCLMVSGEPVCRNYGFKIPLERTDWDCVFL